MQAKTSSPRTGSGVGGDRDVRDRRMLQQSAFHFDRGDVLAGAADNVLAPVDEMQRAVGAAADDVAGVEPAAGPGRGGRVRILQVFAEETKARIGPGVAHQQFARRIGCRRAAILA